jgi:tRNA A-37 threonylcarbamoyl transferase component Bud32
MRPLRTTADFLALVRTSGLLDEATLSRFASRGDLPEDPQGCAVALVRAKLLTTFQAKNLLQGRSRGLVVGLYKLLRPLGQGGMGVVYLAAHTLMRRQVAIKVLPQDKARDTLAVERFFREARAAAALDHPNIVRLHDVCEEEGVHFLVMEYVDGTTLQALLENTGPLHYGQAVDYVAQVAAGLRHAHERGFVHRDIKPANLMVTRQGQVKILDMGLTRSFVDPGDQLTATGMEAETAGTADYIAPEQAMNQPTDARADVYSLGVTLFTLVTGKPPFDGTTAQKLLQHQLKEPPPLSRLGATIPPALGEVVAVMTAKRPEARHQSAEEVIEALSPWVSAAPPLSGVTRARPADAEPAPVTDGTSRKGQADPARAGWGSWTWRNRWAILAAVVVVGLGGIGAAVAGRSGKSAGETKSAETTGAGRVESEPPAPGGPTPRAEPPQHSVTPDPGAAPVPPPAGAVVFRLDMSGIKPFVLKNWGRTIGVAQGDSPGPAGWGAHSWMAECEHELVGAVRDGRMALGIRLTAGPASGRPGAMLYFAGVDVEPNHEYAFRAEYQANGEYAGGDIRFREEPAGKLRIVGRLNPTSGTWAVTSFRFRTGSTERLQLEFHHNGPVGDGNALFLRAAELTDTR